MKRVLPFVVSSIVLLACAGRKSQWQVEPTPQPSTPAEREEGPEDPVALGDALWAERTEVQNVRDAIARWEDAATAKPSDADVLVKLCHAHYFLADAYLRDDPDAYLETLERGVGWGERAMVTVAPEFAAAMSEGAKVHDAIGRVDANGVPAMFWYATTLGKWAKKQGIAVMLGHKADIKATMERVLELDPTFLGGAPHAYFGVYYAVAPAIAGGDLDKSRAHFEAALAVSPHVLSTKVLWAAELAVKEQDEATFDRLLAEVLEADENAVPTIIAENRVEKQKARELLARRGELF